MEKQRVVFGDIKTAIPIRSWREVPDYTRVIEDTYNELYMLRWENGDPYLHHIGWRYCPESRRSEMQGRQLDPPRLADFEPYCMYDQPWFMEG